MDAGRPRQKATGKHEWNSFENYRDIHEKVLEDHALIESHSVVIELFDSDGVTLVAVVGEIRCSNGIVLEVEKYAETGLRRSRMSVRTFSYRYNAYIPGKHTVLRYDNGHEDFEEYHAHRYDPKTGRAGPGQPIATEDMPVMGEVLSELAELFPA